MKAGLGLRIGGVMRCCIGTLNEKEPAEAPEGTTLPCDYCSSGLIVRDGAWEWWRDRPEQFDGEADG